MWAQDGLDTTNMSSERAAEGVGGVFVNRRMPGSLHSSHTRTAYHSVASQLLGARTSCCSNRPASKGAALLASRQLQLMLKLPLFAHAATVLRFQCVGGLCSMTSARCLPKRRTRSHLHSCHATLAFLEFSFTKRCQCNSSSVKSP